MLSEQPAKISSRETLENLDVPDGIITALQREGIESLSQLCQRSSQEVSGIRGLGGKKLIMLKSALAELGLMLCS